MWTLGLCYVYVHVEVRGQSRVPSLAVLYLHFCGKASVLSSEYGCSGSSCDPPVSQSQAPGVVCTSVLEILRPHFPFLELGGSTSWSSIPVKEHSFVEGTNFSTVNTGSFLNWTGKLRLWALASWEYNVSNQRAGRAQLLSFRWIKCKSYDSFLLPRLERNSILPAQP